MHAYDYVNKAKSYYEDLQKLCEGMGIKTEKEEDDDTRLEVSHVVISDIEKKVKDIEQRRFDKAQFWENQLNEHGAKLSNKKEEKLKSSIDFVACMLMRQIHKSPGKDFDVLKYSDMSKLRNLPSSHHRRELHQLLLAKASAAKDKKQLKATYGDEFRQVQNTAHSVFSELSDIEKRGLKKQFDQAMKVLDSYHKKYKA